MKNHMFCSTTQSFQTIKNAFGQFAFATLLTLFMFNGLMSAESAPKQFVSFQNFIENAKTASSGAYVGHTGKRVKDAASFEEMRQHALQMYNGVHVSHSFLLDSHYFDCVPVEEQPSFRMLGQKQIATPPPTPPPHQQLGEDAPVAASQIGPGNQFDQFGNSTHCEDNTIPMRRLTLEDMSQFENLKQFLAKGRDGASRFTRPNDPQPNGDGYVHHYAYAQQNVNNLGGNSDLNLWNPYVNTGVGGETMSLSQEWYVGGSPTQTAEVGWQNQPNTWGSENSVLFIYWTADDYNNTGCYNLDCGAFTQTNNNWYFGSGFNNYSSIGGSQYYFSAEYFLSGGNWWLALGGQWVGYYPASIYGGGQMSRNAQIIQYGGEVAALTQWPPMGSGQWSSKGWKYAAYQDDIWYFDTHSAKWWAGLTLEQPSKHCFTDSFLTYAPTSFYFGGPGGKGC
jgi:hypothetical protein